jgi:hypothetical protein
MTTALEATDKDFEQMIYCRFPGWPDSSERWRSASAGRDYGVSMNNTSIAGVRIPDSNQKFATHSQYKSKIKTFVSFLWCIAVLGAALPAFSQSWLAGVTLVRGVVESISGDMLTVESQTGPVKIHFGSPLQLYRDMPSDLAHVNSTSFVGVTSVKQPDGSEQATEIHIFPEELRGTGEGSYLLDQSQTTASGNSRMNNGIVSKSRMTSRMTNGTVNTTPGASTLAVQYKGGTQTISVPANIPVTVLALSQEALKQGQNVLVLATKQQDGLLTATRIISRGNAPTK